MDALLLPKAASSTEEVVGAATPPRTKRQCASKEVTANIKESPSLCFLRRGQPLPPRYAPLGGCLHPPNTSNRALSARRVDLAPRNCKNSTEFRVESKAPPPPRAASPRPPTR